MRRKLLQVQPFLPTVFCISQLELIYRDNRHDKIKLLGRRLYVLNYGSKSELPCGIYVVINLLTIICADKSSRSNCSECCVTKQLIGHYGASSTYFRDDIITTRSLAVNDLPFYLVMVKCSGFTFAAKKICYNVLLDSLSCRKAGLKQESAMLRYLASPYTYALVFLALSPFVRG